VVLDAPGSVFSKLWALTAPEYALRTNQVHEYLTSMKGASIGSTTFTTRVADPFALPPSTRMPVLSLLCYSEFEELEVDKQQLVEDLVRQNVVGGDLQCTCRCYRSFRKTATTR